MESFLTLKEYICIFRARIFFKQKHVKAIYLFYLYRTKRSLLVGTFYKIIPYVIKPIA